MSLRRISFVVYDNPKPAARPRFARRGDKTFTYIPKGDQENRNSIRDAFLEEVGEPWEPLQGPLRLVFCAWLPMPASIPKKRRETALPSKRPDLDNFIKQVEDALNHYAFRDDAQVVTIEARKRYAKPPFMPCWVISLDEIEE